MKRPGWILFNKITWKETWEKRHTRVFRKASRERIGWCSRCMRLSRSSPFESSWGRRRAGPNRTPHSTPDSRRKTRCCLRCVVLCSLLFDWKLYNLLLLLLLTWQLEASARRRERQDHNSSVQLEMFVELLKTLLFFV